MGRRKESIVWNWKAVLVASLLLVSCSTFRNVTTYFNVLYLAQKHLDIYEEQLSAESSTQNAAVATAYTHHWLEEEYQTYLIRRKHGVPIVAFNLVSKPKVALIKGAASQHLDSAIILGSKILADKKPTKYVEDALFIVGKALFYKNDYEGSKRKFYELLYRYPDTKYTDQTGMLLAESLVETGQTDSATASLETILKHETSSEVKLRSDIHKTFADLLVSSSYDTYDRATEELLLAEQGLSGLAYSQLEFDRGRLFFVSGKWEKAEQAFRNAVATSTDITFQGEAMSGLAESLRRQNKFDETKKTFSEVVTKTRYAPTAPSSQYELTYTTDLEVRTKVQNVIRTPEFISATMPGVKSAYAALDTTYRNVSQAIMVRSRFRQAELFRETGQYDSAARIANIIIGTKDFSTPEMNDFVNDRMRALTRFAEWKYQLTRIDTLERLLRKLRRPGNVMMETVEAELRNDAIREFVGSKWSPTQNYTFTPEEEAKINILIEKTKKQKQTAGINVFSINFSDTARFIDSVHRIEAKAHFEIGRALESFEEYTDAIKEYKISLASVYSYPDTASTKLQAQVLFSWVQLDHELGRIEERDSLIEILTHNFGETVYAQQAGLEYGGKRDKDSPGEVAFRSASAALRSSNIESAKPALLAVVSTYPREDVAARAIYAIGIGYEDAKQSDSALYFYSRLTKEYPFSKYSVAVKSRYSYALQEFDKRRAPQPDPKPIPPKK